MIALEVPSSLESSQIQLTIRPDNEGPMAALMPAPVLRANDLSVKISEWRDGACEIHAIVPVAGLQVTCPELPEKDRAKIERLVRETLLAVAAHPFASFDGELRTSGDDENGLRAAGTLSLRGQARPVAIVFREEVAAKWMGRLTIRQSDFGITPASAFLGALRSRDEVTLELRVQLKT